MSFPIAHRTMAAAEIRESLATLGEWYHQIDLGNDILTPGFVPLQTLIRYADVYFKMGIVGLSVLDVGAWNGFFSFDAERRGAARTLAADKFCWGFGSNYPYGRQQFEFARAVLGSQIEDRIIDIPEMTVHSMGHFDIVLFNGIVYHIIDPISAIINMSEIATKILIIETVIDCLEYPRAAMVFYPAEKASFGSPQNGWGPNSRLLHALLRKIGFEIVLEFETPGAGNGRSIFIAFKPGHGYDEFVANHIEFAKPRVIVPVANPMSKEPEPLAGQKAEQPVLKEADQPVMSWQIIASHVRKRIVHYFRK